MLLTILEFTALALFCLATILTAGILTGAI